MVIPVPELTTICVIMFLNSYLSQIIPKMIIIFIVYLNPFSPEHMGLLDPSTSDGRVIFFLPWLKGTIAGTTDLPCKVTHNPKPTEDEILFILTEVKNYLNPDVEGMAFLSNVKKYRTKAKFLCVVIVIILCLMCGGRN